MARPEPRYVVLHVQDGTNQGSLDWFQQATTQSSMTVLVSRDGEVWRVVREKDGPWSNGGVQDPTPKAQNGILALGGNPNIWTLSISAEGQSGDEPTAEQVEAIGWQVRDWMDRYGIPADNVLRHADLDQANRGSCPGDGLYDVVMTALAWTTS